VIAIAKNTFDFLNIILSSLDKLFFNVYMEQQGSGFPRIVGGVYI